MDCFTKLLAKSEPCIPGFTPICPAVHPNGFLRGMLIRNDQTGIYVLALGRVINSVPQKWARDLAAAAIAK